MCLFCISSFILLSAHSKHFPTFLFESLVSNFPSFFSLLWHFSKLPQRDQTVSFHWPRMLLLTATAICPFPSFVLFYPSSPIESTWAASSISIFQTPPKPLFQLEGASLIYSLRLCVLIFLRLLPHCCFSYSSHTFTHLAPDAYKSRQNDI